MAGQWSDVSKPYSMSELGVFLEQAREEGLLDSAGSITLNTVEGRRKLDIYRLEGLHHYVLPLVSSAVLSGATCIDFKGDFRNLEVDFDGRSFSQEDLTQALEAQRGRAAELGHFLRTVKISQPTQLRLACADGYKIHLLTMQGDEPKLSSLANPLGLSNTNVQIRGADVGDNSPSLRSFLAERCGYTPTVAIGGKRVHVPCLVDSCGAVRFQSPHPENPATSLRSWVTVKCLNEDISGQVWMAESDANHIAFVLNGVTYPTTVAFRSLTGLHGVIACPKLNLDLSRSGVIQGEDFHRILELVEEQFESRVMPLVLREFHGMMPLDRSVARRHLQAYSQKCSPEMRKRIETRLSSRRGK